MRRLATVAVALSVLLTPTAVHAAAAQPSDFGTPSDALVSQSIHAWKLDGHVKSLRQQRQEQGEKVVSLDSDILFAFGSDALPPTAGAAIKAALGEAAQGASVSVTGHTDNIGSASDNLALSQRRAAAVAAAIASTRPDLKLSVDGKGESQPVANNGDADGREANRRVELRYN